MLKFVVFPMSLNWYILSKKFLNLCSFTILEVLTDYDGG